MEAKAGKVDSKSELQCLVSANDHPVRSWWLPKALVCHHSPLFRAALTGNFKEVHDNRITFPEDDPYVFEMYIQWMYAGDYRNHSAWSHTNEDDTGEKDFDNCTTVKAWILGDKLGVPAFKNKVMVKLFETYIPRNKDPETWYIAPDAVALAYSSTIPNSKLRQFYLHAAV